MSEVERVCSTLVDRPDNVLVGRLCSLLNNSPDVDVEMVLSRCGRHLSGMHLEGLFSHLIDSRQSNVIGIYLETVQDLTESQLVRALSVSLSHLSGVLCRPCDYWSLVTNLRLHLNASQAVEVGEQLVSRLSRSLDSCPMIVDWLCALLDGHFSSFVLVKWKRLSELREIVSARLNTLEQLQGLNPRKKSLSTTTNVDKLYTLQRIDLK